MTEHKTLNTVIHAAFRRDLARFDTALATFPDGHRPRAEARAQELGRAWDNYALQLAHHHRDEETIFWPAFRELGFDPTIAGELDNEHQRMSDALDEATAKMRGFRSDPSEASAANARTAVVAFGAVLTSHLAHEEHDLEPFVVDHLDTQQLKTAQAAVRKAHKGNAGTFFAWLEDGAAPEEASIIRKEIPAPVLWLITRTGGRSYRRKISPTWA
jgi:hypothetical protein